jgi:hypothetical protein
MAAKATWWLVKVVRVEMGSPARGLDSVTVARNTGFAVLQMRTVTVDRDASRSLGSVFRLNNPGGNHV